MKTSFWLTVLLLLPSFCFGADLTLEDSAEWQPMNQAQLDLTTKGVAKAGGQVVDGSIMKVHGGGATIISAPMSRGVNKTAVDSFVSSYVQGVERSGAKLVDRQATTIGSLPGVSFLFQAEKNGRKASMVSYLVFTNRLCYVVMCYPPTEGTRADPLVQSYLARIKVAPAVVPGNIAKAASVDINSVAYRIGEAGGAIIFFLALGGGVFAVVRGSLRGRRKTKPPPLPQA